MRDLFFASLFAAAFFAIALLMSYARNLGIEVLVACVAFFGFIAIVTGIVIYETISDYKLLHKAQK